MALWGCQLNGAFLDCAGVMYTPGERALLGAVVVLLVTGISYAAVKLAGSR